MKTVKEIEQAIDFSKEAVEDCNIQWQHAALSATIGILEWVLELDTPKAKMFQLDYNKNLLVLDERNQKGHAE